MTHPRLTIELTPAEKAALDRIRARRGLRSLNAAVRALVAEDEAKHQTKERA